MIPRLYISFYLTFIVYLQSTRMFCFTKRYINVMHRYFIIVSRANCDIAGKNSVYLF